MRAFMHAYAYGPGVFWLIVQARNADDKNQTLNDFWGPGCMAPMHTLWIASIRGGSLSEMQLRQACELVSDDGVRSVRFAVDAARKFDCTAVVASKLKERTYYQVKATFVCAGGTLVVVTSLCSCPNRCDCLDRACSLATCLTHAAPARSACTVPQRYVQCKCSTRRGQTRMPACS